MSAKLWGMLGVVVLLSFQSVWAAGKTTIVIGYAQLDDDPRYRVDRRYAGIEFKPRGRPLPGAEVALRESRIVGRAIGIKFRLEKVSGKSAPELAEAVVRLHEKQNVSFVLVDAPAEALLTVADATQGKPLLLFNISESADELRGNQCRPHLMHTIPSYAMLADSLAQYLVTKQWKELLLLQGTLPSDRAFGQAFWKTARKFGLKITEEREFILSNDPRQRDQNNIVLLTAHASDVVLLVDTDGEFGRYVPYQTVHPRPVVGTAGLVPSAWHWAWERHGAPQLNQRFVKKAKRKMLDSDWAAWAAVKVIVESVLRTKSTDFETVTGYLKGDQLTLDAYKGTPASFRPWNNQLRQSILLHTHNAVVERAPLKGFLHPTQNLDTLGVPPQGSECRMEK
ncbi:MAG: ABC transporter substrate-binding protein [SAR324 cluster bacterium]|nr:ABC transporter substrate-binding protein [SAR324 cluster bacterium]